MEESRKHVHPKSAHWVYVVIISLVFAAFTVVFLFFPRTEYSELEKRDLASFPNPAEYSGNISRLPADISQWFSDSEPYRDQFMTMSMQIRNLIALRRGNPEDQISFKPTDPATETTSSSETDYDEELLPSGNPMADENAKLSNSGTIVIGAGDNVRALMAFGGTQSSAGNFTRAVNRYAEAFPGQNLYALVAPLATEFYLPTKGASFSKPQKPVIDNIRENLNPKVKFVDAYSYLAAHTNEDIYLRTDHHWAPLGAFYAAKAFARTAGVPFKELDSYEPHVIHRFVGSMYGYTKDIAVKNAPEDFVYYKPNDLNYKSIFTTFNTNKNYQITSASKPYESEFFKKFKDGSGNAYLTFMGSDQNLVKVTTDSGSPRKLLIIKDSYGNALPGYLFYSFGEVHVVDFRYFPYNIKQYVADNGITDILLAFNIFNACGSAAANKITAFIDKPTGFGNTSPREETSELHETTKQIEPATPRTSQEETEKAPAIETPIGEGED